MSSAIAAPDVQPIIFVSIGLVGSTLYLCSAEGSVVWSGSPPITWVGDGTLMGIGDIEQGPTPEPRGVIITLSAFNSTALSDIMSTDAGAPGAVTFRLGLPVSIYIGALSGGSVIATPILYWQGYTDMATVTVDPKGALIALNCEGAFVTLNNPVDRRYTSQDQNMDWPSDLVYQFVFSIQDVNLNIAGQAPGAKVI